MQKYIILFLGILAGCSTTAPAITSPGMTYKQDGIKVSLDVADIKIVNAYKVPRNRNKVLPANSIVPAVQEWAKTRFVPKGKQGTVIIKIVNAAVNEQNLVAPKDMHILLNSNDKPMKYGVNLTLEISVQDSAAYTEGKIKTSLSRQATMDSDVVLGFNPDIWTEFMDTLINSLDHKVQVDLKTYLPNLLISATSTPAGPNAIS